MLVTFSFSFDLLWRTYRQLSLCASSNKVRNATFHNAKNIAAFWRKIWAPQKMVATFYWNKLDVCRHHSDDDEGQLFASRMWLSLKFSFRLEFSWQGKRQPKMGLGVSMGGPQWNFWSSSGTSKRIEIFFSTLLLSTFQNVTNAWICFASNFDSVCHLEITAIKILFFSQIKVCNNDLEEFYESWNVQLGFMQILFLSPSNDRFESVGDEIGETCYWYATKLCVTSGEMAMQAEIWKF